MSQTEVEREQHSGAPVTGSGTTDDHRGLVASALPSLDSDQQFMETGNSGERESASHRLRLWVRDLGISVFASLLIITFLYQPVKVEGTSMQPELRDQDRLFINKFVYHFEKIERGDVVVFHYPRDPAKSYIKRVVGLPGDDLRIEQGRVFLNGVELHEPYLPRRYQDARSVPEAIIPAGEYWVMGDHRSISSDSRDFGPVERGLIYGKAAFVYWPTAKMGVVR